MEEFAAGFFVGLVVASAAILLAWSVHTHVMRKEAIKRNAASWVTDDNGVTEFKWNPIPEISK